MACSEELIVKRIDSACFSLRIYEIYSRRMPGDKALHGLCEKYSELITEMITEHAEKQYDYILEQRKL